MRPNEFISPFSAIHKQTRRDTVFLADVPRVVSHSLLAWGLLAAGVGAASAAPQAVDFEHFIIAEAALTLGDCGAIMAQQSADYAESDTPTAIERTAALLSATSTATSEIAAGLLFLCESHGMSSCEAAVEFGSVSDELARASGLVASHDYALASESLARATDQLEALFPLTGGDGLPDSLRESYRAAMQSLDEASAVLSVLGDGSTFGEAHRHLSSVQSQGLEAMLQQLQTPANFGWPAGFLGAELLTGSNFAGQWAPGTTSTTGLSHPVSQQILNDWSQTTSAQLVADLGGGALLLAIHNAGHNLRDAMYGLRAYINSRHAVGILCEIRCLNDNVCAPCRISKLGFGFARANPEQVDEARLIIELLLAIEVKRRGVAHSPEWLRDSVNDAVNGLLDQLQSNSGFLYITVEEGFCHFSPCWIFWDESECRVRASGWIKVPLPIAQQMTPPRMWSKGDWRGAQNAAQRAAAAWCAAN